MAKKKQPADTDTVEKIQDEIVVEETPAQSEEDSQTAAETPEDITEVAEASDTDATPDEVTSYAEPEPVAPQIKQRGLFFPVLTGSVVAGAIGFFAAQFAEGDWPFEQFAQPSPADAEMTAKVTALETALAELKAQMPSADQAAETNDVSQQALQAAKKLEDEQAKLSTAMSGIDKRISKLERAPVAEGAASTEATAQLEAQIKSLQDSVEAQKSTIETMADEAKAKENSATEMAQSAIRRAAVTRVLTALDTGDDFTGAVNDLKDAGAEVPDILAQNAASQVPTLNALISSFAPAARNALAGARTAQKGEGSFGDRLLNFLDSSLEARSVAPREGDDADAILSRAEAATKEARLGDALAELDTLPEVAKSAMSEWIAAATLRRDALDAAAALAQNTNN